MTTLIKGERRSRLRLWLGTPALVSLGIIWFLLYTVEFLTGCFIGEPVRAIDRWIESLGRWINTNPDHARPAKPAAP